jgi:hypothetical protein
LAEIRISSLQSSIDHDRAAKMNMYQSQSMQGEYPGAITGVTIDDNFVSTGLG